MSTFGDLLTLNNELKIHQKHLRLRAVQIYQSRNKPNPRSSEKYAKVIQALDHLTSECCDKNLPRVPTKYVT